MLSRWTGASAWARPHRRRERAKGIDFAELAGRCDGTAPSQRRRRGWPRVPPWWVGHRFLLTARMGQRASDALALVMLICLSTCPI